MSNSLNLISKFVLGQLLRPTHLRLPIYDSKWTSKGTSHCNGNPRRQCISGIATRNFGAEEMQIRSNSSLLPILGSSNSSGITWNKFNTSRIHKFDHIRKIEIITGKSRRALCMRSLKCTKVPHSKSCDSWKLLPLRSIAINIRYYFAILHAPFGEQ